MERHSIAEAVQYFGANPEKTKKARLGLDRTWTFRLKKNRLSTGYEYAGWKAN
jgi:hypothetical protein